LAWLKVDDKRALHRKFRRQGFAVRGLDEAAMCFCAHEETDGFVSEEALEDLSHHHGVTLTAAKKLVASLVKIDRWSWDDKKQAWKVKDYLKYNPSHAELEAARKRDRERKRKPPDDTPESVPEPDGSDADSSGNP
jgi:hypothetical protein